MFNSDAEFKEAIAMYFGRAVDEPAEDPTEVVSTIDGSCLYKACLGIVRLYDCSSARPYRAVYDYDKLVEAFMEQENWTEEEAIEWIDYNVEGSIFLGCPIFFPSLPEF